MISIYGKLAVVKHIGKPYVIALHCMMVMMSRFVLRAETNHTRFTGDQVVEKL